RFRDRNRMRHGPLQDARDGDAAARNSCRSHGKLTMRSIGYEYRFRDPYATPQQKGAPAPTPSRRVEAGMIIERNVGVGMRDGVKILVDIFRPVDEQPAPPIISWTPYGKHQNGRASFKASPGCEVTPDMVSDYATFEGVDPVYWVPRG